ncbi:response regulator transcription factor [uncultured Pontibacter sp.]|uniref:response regulator n=1 Tax=uncultured Pontibacter sp. TaxID=453356 RepID=UPI0026020B25|nr:response regulator transcription factor [uncultured Pontibacter sp.]
MKQSDKIRIIITDDHKIIREGICSLLANNEEIEIVGDASNGAEALDLLATTPADVVLMDVNMPVMDGYEATRAIHEQYPDTKVVALSVLNDETCIHRMLESGALGYILKSSGKEELFMAIKLVYNGTPYISSDAAMQLLDRVINPLQEGETHGNESNILSKREMEVLALIAEGYTNAEIADKLFTSKRTIETHRQNILEKTKSKNTAKLIKYAFQNKLIA